LVKHWKLIAVEFAELDAEVGEHSCDVTDRNVVIYFGQKPHGIPAFPAKANWLRPSQWFLYFTIHGIRWYTIVHCIARTFCIEIAFFFDYLLAVANTKEKQGPTAKLWPKSKELLDRLVVDADTQQIELLHKAIEALAKYFYGHNNNLLLPVDYGRSFKIFKVQIVDDETAIIAEAGPELQRQPKPKKSAKPK
jgi:hypothetical protein